MSDSGREWPSEMSDSDYRQRFGCSRGPMDDTILPIQIRPSLTVLVQGLPHDLKPEEAAKIAGVVLALSRGTDRQ